MSEASSAPDPDEAFLLHFQKEYEAAEDKDAVVERYCALRPDLAERIRARAKMLPMLERSAAEPEEPPPERLGEFIILREVGGGGMGKIYEAKHERLGRRVAVKTIRPDRASPEARGRFAREQRALARLHQTHIVSILQAGEEGPVQYFAMPYIDGAALNHVVRAALQREATRPRGRTPTLGQLAAQVAAESDHDAWGSTARASSGGRLPAVKGPPPPEAPAGALALSADYFRSVAEAVADAAEALHHAHGAGLVHRDMKPSNLMVDRQGRCWVIDFGLAGELARPRADGGAPDPVLSAEPMTAAGLVGTPQYMAPEQWGQGEVDARTDVWGLGATLYELLTLRRAFDGTVEELSRKIPVEEPAPPRSLVRNLPADLAAICRKALRKKPGERYATALALAEDLRCWLRGEPTQALGARAPRRAWLWARRNQGWAAAISVALAGVLALGLVGFLWQRSGKLQAEARERERRFESLRQQILNVRLATRFEGWSGRAWALVEEAAAIRKDDADLRDQAAATLVGLDGRAVELPEKVSASSVAFDAKGRLLLGGLDADEGAGRPAEPARLWDGTGAPLRRSRRKGAGPVAFRPDGTPLQLVVDSEDRRSLLLWDVGRQQLVHKFELPAAEAPVLGLAANGAYVAAAAGDKVEVWDAKSGDPVRSLPVKATALAVTTDGTAVAVGDREGRITVWPLPTGEPLATLTAGRTEVLCLAFHPDVWRSVEGKEGRPAWVLASGDAGGTAVLWDLQARRDRAYFRGSRHGVHAVAFSPDNMTLATAGRSEVRLWDAATGRLLWVNGGNDYVTGLAFSPSGSKLASAGRQLFSAGEARVWQLESGRGMEALRGLKSQVFRVVFSWEGRSLAALSHDWQVAVWDLGSGHLRHVLNVSPGMFVDNAALAFSRDERRLAFASGTKATLWELATGKVVDSWVLPFGFVDTMAFGPGDTPLLLRVETQTGKWEGWRKNPRFVHLRRLLPGKRLEKVGAPLGVFRRRVFVAVAAPDGSNFALEGCGGPDGRRSLVVLDGVSGRTTWSRLLNKEANWASLATDPPGKILAFSAEDRGVTTLVEMSSGKPTGTRDAFPAWMAPETRYWAVHGSLLSNPSPGCVLFGVEKKSPLVALGVDTTAANNTERFDTQGRRLAWGNTDGSVMVCDLEEARWRLAGVGLGW